MRNIKEIPGRHRTVLKVLRLQSAALDQEKELRIWEGKEGTGYSAGEPISMGRNLAPESTQDVYSLSQIRQDRNHSSTHEQIVYSVGDEKPMPVREARVRAHDIPRLKELFANILSRDRDSKSIS